MSKTAPQTLVVVLSHVLNKDVHSLFSKVKNELSEIYPVKFLSDNTKNYFDCFKGHDDFVLFTTEELDSLEYFGGASVRHSEGDRHDNPNHKYFNFTPGRTDLPLMFLGKQFPNYDYYWVIEYDVRFSGNWLQLIRFFEGNDADLLTTTITRYDKIPNWYHWPSLDTMDGRDGRTHWIRAFLPVYRLSRRAYEQLDRDLRRGASGHYECLLPTLLHNAGLRIEDIGGDGDFVQPGNINRFYRNTPTTGSLAPGTFVFRPIIPRPGREPDKLWHPVKSQPWRRRAAAGMETLLRSAARRLTGRGGNRG